MLLAIIPARGGSKGIPRKNMALLGGRPLVEYSIEAAKKSRFIDEILLSTDDDEIASVGRHFGLDVSYRRPAELAEDETAMIDTLEHGLHWIGNARGRLPDEVILLQPTSPLRSVQDIDGAIALFNESGAISLVSVHPMGEHPCECIVGNSKEWKYLAPPPGGAVRRQDYENNFFFINGAIYLTGTKTLLSRRSFVYPQETVMFVMPRERGMDIDTYLDLNIAEAIIGFAGPNAG
jgi:CMP-N,N'-diacetyllegionaminic acid synthase